MLYRIATIGLLVVLEATQLWGDMLYVTQVEPTGVGNAVAWSTQRFDSQANRMDTFVESGEIPPWSWYGSPVEFEYHVDTVRDRLFIGHGHISWFDLATDGRDLIQIGGRYESMALTADSRGGSFAFVLHEEISTYGGNVNGFTVIDRKAGLKWIGTGIDEGIVAVDQEGNIYVTGPDISEIVMYDRFGESQGTFASGIEQASDMVFDRSGNLYVSERQSGVVKQFDAAGNFLGVFADGLDEPTHLTFDTGGTLYVAAKGTRTVERFADSGTPLGTYVSDVLGPIALVPDFAGDANLDGKFDQYDLVQVLQAGKYLADERAYWSEGDWNRDARFDQLDIIAGLDNYMSHLGRYEARKPVDVTFVPEPSSVVLLAAASIWLATLYRPERDAIR